jgi:hypothetical protein
MASKEPVVVGATSTTTTTPRSESKSAAKTILVANEVALDPFHDSHEGTLHKLRLAYQPSLPPIFCSMPHVRLSHELDAKAKEAYDVRALVKS